jgi:hypothetical protein
MFFERDGQPQARLSESAPNSASTLTLTENCDPLTSALEKKYETAIKGWQELIRYHQVAGRGWILDFHCDKEESSKKEDSLVELLNVPDLFLFAFFKIALSE